METRGPNTRDMGVEKRKIANRKSEQEDTITFIRLVRERERERRASGSSDSKNRENISGCSSLLQWGPGIKHTIFFYYYFTLARANFEYPIFL